MSDWIATARPAISATLLVGLLTWESFGPFFAFFVKASGARVRHGARNLTLGVVNAAVNGLACVGLWSTVAGWAGAHGFGLLRWLSLPPWANLVGVFVLVDLWMYAWHRLNHRVPFLWRFHRVHHSDPHMDVTTANRFHLGEMLLSCGLRVPVIAVIGVELWELAFYELAMFTVVQLHHANISLSAPLDRVLRLIIVTPFMHKVHHSNWQPETDSNYSSLFSWWDRLFRTFRMRDDPRTLHFGLDELNAAEHQTLVGLLKTPARQMENHRRAMSRETLIVFTRFPVAGRAKTRLIPLLGDAGAAQLQREMTEHVLARVWPLVIRRGVKLEVRFDDGSERDMRRWLGRGLKFRPQGGGDLGARMGRATKDAFEAGAQAVVVIGADCPDLNAAVVGRAFDSLRAHPLVFGPAKDGGYYLIGLHAAQPQLFEGIAWGTGAVLPT